VSARRRLAPLVRRFGREEEGVIAVLMALCMIVLLGFTALVVDAGLLFVDRTQLQKAADAAALAGAYDLWPGDGSHNSTATNTAADAATLAQSNGVNPTQTVSSASSCPVAVTCWVGAQGGQSATVYDAGDAWKVTIARRVPLVFAPVLGIPAGTVQVSAVALNSPLSSCDAACILPYAVWGGNNTQNNPGPPNWLSSDANAWCSGVQWTDTNGDTQTGAAPCSTPPNSDADWTVPGGETQYNYQYLCEKASTCGYSGPPPPTTTIVYRDNSYNSDVVWPDPNKCANNKQAPCSANWDRNSSTAFNGFFNNISAPLTTGSAGSFWSKAGNSTGTEPWARICSLAQQSPAGDGIFPLVDDVRVDGSSGNTIFHIASFVALTLQAPNGCTGGNAMGQSPFTGTVDWGATIPHGQGGGPKTSPVHVIQLWQ
jgi:Flp pilus assembly protein TadG